MLKVYSLNVQFFIRIRFQFEHSICNIIILIFSSLLLEEYESVFEGRKINQSKHKKNF